MGPANRWVCVTGIDFDDWGSKDEMGDFAGSLSFTDEPAEPPLSGFVCPSVDRLAPPRYPRAVVAGGEHTVFCALPAIKHVGNSRCGRYRWACGPGDAAHQRYWTVPVFGCFDSILETVASGTTTERD